MFRRELTNGISETYYCRFRVRGKDGKLSRCQLDTGARELRAAIKWATAQRDAMVSGQKNQVIRARLAQDRPGVASIGDMLQAWLAHQHGCNEASAADTVAGFRMVWREALGQPDNDALDRQPAVSMTQARLLDWIATRQGLKRPDFRMARPGNNNLRARMREVRSILATRRSYCWTEAGLRVPDFSWVGAVPMPMEEDKPFALIDQVTMAKIEAVVEAHPEEQIKRAFWLMRLLAMRNSEVAACRVGWAETMAGRRVIRICHRPHEGFTLKRSANVRLLEIPERCLPWFEGDASSYILTGSHTERTSAVWRRLSLLLRPFLPGRTKSCYELRKQRISEEMISTGSIVAAAALAGDLVQTIEAHYCDISANLPALRAASGYE